MKQSQNINQVVAKESLFGIIPILTGQRIYRFFDAFMVLSGYCIATWSYTQGAYLATLVTFKQLLIGAFAGALLMLVIYQLPVILSARYGIDIWIWLRTVFGHHGVKIISLIIIAINFPWYAVCADLFGSSMMNLIALFGANPPPGLHVFLAISCVVIGTAIAYKGIGAITWTTRILVPLLLFVGVLVIVIGFSSVSFDVIWHHIPDTIWGRGNIIPYIICIEANFAFVITLVGGMAEIPRLTKTERGGFWAGVFGQGFSGSLFVVVGAVMAIAMQHVTGSATEDPTLMLATLAGPGLALCSLILVAFSNIGTQAVGSYIYGVMLKSSFRKVDYRILITILAAYVTLLCIWGKITEYFGSFLTISACIYAPLAALLFVDFFFVRKQKISLRSAFNLPGYHAYDYSNGINWIGFLCIVFGVAMSLLIYNPITTEVHNQLLFHLTPTGFAFLSTGVFYFVVCSIPAARNYVLRDRNELTV